MKKLLILTAIFATMIAPAFAGAKDFVKAGTVLLPQGMTALGPPSFNVGYGCRETSPMQGVDVLWVKLPAGSPGHHVTATASDSVINDVDVYFGSGGCVLVPGSLESPGNESGTVPPGAAWATLALNTGANATVTLTVEDVLL